MVQNTQQEKMKHSVWTWNSYFEKPEWRAILKSVLFVKGDIIENAKR